MSLPEAGKGTGNREMGSRRLIGRERYRQKKCLTMFCSTVEKPWLTVVYRFQNG